MTQGVLEEFKQRALDNDFEGSDALFAPMVSLHSPTSEKPVYGRPMTILCIKAAINLLHEGSFSVVRTVQQDDSAIMEFESDIDGVPINGADFIRWNNKGEISEFKVMVRPQMVANTFCDLMTKHVREQIRSSRS